MDQPLNITKTLRAMLERVARLDGRLLELQVTANGGAPERALNLLRKAALVEPCDHPTVKDAFKYPATALRLTDSGKKLTGVALIAKTAAERVNAMRQRRKEAGILRLEVFAAKADHAAITAYAAKLTQKRAKENTHGR